MSHVDLTDNQLAAALEGTQTRLNELMLECNDRKYSVDLETFETSYVTGGRRLEVVSIRVVATRPITMKPYKPKE